MDSYFMHQMIISQALKKLYGPLFMDGVQLPQGCRATKRREFTQTFQIEL